MKKIVFIALALLVSLSVSAKKDKVLVTYFSATGTTKAVAERIAKAAGADLFEIAPDVKYTDADLDWRNLNSRSSVEMKDKTSRPKMLCNAKKMKKYTKIYIGFPIWWNVCPRIVNTFIESNDLKGKVLIPFATSGSSKIDNSCKDLKETYPTLTWGEGKLMNAVTDAEIKAWVK
ncbi:MAG: flavodoxin [Prevotellaceae bacterium]|nr:flavodoxin [Prevotellaceae bacterium]